MTAQDVQAAAQQLGAIEPNAQEFNGDWASRRRNIVDLEQVKF